MKKYLLKTALVVASTALSAIAGLQVAHADSYVVQQGDSFFELLSAHGMSPYDLAAKNGKSILIQSTQVMFWKWMALLLLICKFRLWCGSNADLVSDVDDVVLNTLTDYGNSYPIGQCTWGVKELALGQATGGECQYWAINASNQGYVTGTVPDSRHQSLFGTGRIWPRCLCYRCSERWYNPSARS